jgi:homocysteine S-methyltransferase
MGTELQRRGINAGLPLWSAAALTADTEAVYQIHCDYIDAGADIITTDTFRTTRRTFLHAGREDRSAELTRTAAKLAQSARDARPGRTVLIAGSIAPLEDCYRPDLVPFGEDLIEEHAELASGLADAGVDFLLLETMGTLREAYVACTAAKATGKEVVVSFLCRRDGNLYGGDSLPEAVRRITELGPTAYSLNCISPRYLGRALGVLRSVTDLPIAVYANVGVPGQERGEAFQTDVEIPDYVRHAGSWIDGGAKILGGCCGTTPAYIRALSVLVEARDPSRKHITTTNVRSGDQ